MRGPAADPGHHPFEAAEAYFQAMHQRGSLAHAWLLIGPAGVGKAMLARRLAGLVLGSPQPMIGSARADLLAIGEDETQQPTGREILIEDARAVGLFLRRTAVGGGWRAVIVRRAERLNRSAANALLKLFEEPPPKVLILLTCNAPARLPPTIRSRCRTLRLPPLGEVAMRRIVADVRPELPAVLRERVIAQSDGSPGRAIALLEEGVSALRELIDSVLADPGQTAGFPAYGLSERVLSLDDGSSNFFGLLSQAICSTIRHALSDEGEGKLVFLSQRPAYAWAEICLKLNHLRDEAERFNLDKRQAVLTGLGLLSG